MGWTVRIIIFPINIAVAVKKGEFECVGEACIPANTLSNNPPPPRLQGTAGITN